MLRFPSGHACARAALLAIVVACLAASIVPAGAREHFDARGDVRVAALPGEARAVLLLIRAGGPFRHERDGVTFGNREHALPLQKRGYYHEYTVTTPGMRTRGARRIVCGGPRTAPEVCYYSDDHYATFRRIRP
jgi:ribonuclease T1